jgi:hypothetical protein
MGPITPLHETLLEIIDIRLIKTQNLYNPKIHYDSLALDPLMSQMNPAHVTWNVL